jgi:hypothetical protein
LWNFAPATRQRSFVELFIQTELEVGAQKECGHLSA